MYSEISHLVSLLSLLYDFSKNFFIRVEGHYVRSGHYVVDILVCPVSFLIWFALNGMKQTSIAAQLDLVTI